MIRNERTPKDLRLRRGKVFLHEPYINSNPEDILTLLSHFVVVRADNDFMRNGVTYYGYSHLFETAEFGDEIDEYDIILNRNWRGICTSIRAIKRKE